MRASELKYNYELNNPDGKFFTHENMKFGGDRMSNYGVRRAAILTYADPEPVEVWELYRKRPVRHGLISSAYFELETFMQRHARL